MFLRILTAKSRHFRNYAPTGQMNSFEQDFNSLGKKCPIQPKTRVFFHFLTEREDKRKAKLHLQCTLLLQE